LEVAERGYFKSEGILACYDAGITAYVPKPMTSGAKAGGRFNNPKRTVAIESNQPLDGG
jgi:hypothetical protein